MEEQRKVWGASVEAVEWLRRQPPRDPLGAEPQGPGLASAVDPFRGLAEGYMPLHIVDANAGDNSEEAPFIDQDEARDAWAKAERRNAATVLPDAEHKAAVKAALDALLRQKAPELCAATRESAGRVLAEFQAVVPHAASYAPRPCPDLGSVTEPVGIASLQTDNKHEAAPEAEVERVAIEAADALLETLGKSLVADVAWLVRLLEVALKPLMQHDEPDLRAATLKALGRFGVVYQMAAPDAPPLQMDNKRLRDRVAELEAALHEGGLTFSDEDGRQFPARALRSGWAR